MKTPSSAKSFNDLLIDSLREGLSVMLDEKAAKSFVAQLEEKTSNQHDYSVGEKPEIISEDLRKVFGDVATRIENVVAALLYSKLGMEFTNRNATFCDYIEYAKTHGASLNGVSEAATRLDSTDIQIIDSLRNDARKPVVQLSKEIGVSRPTVINRLNRLLSSNVISLNACLNLSEMNFRTSLVALEAKGTESRQELEKLLAACPRVLMLLRPTDKANMLILVYGEDQNTLNSTIETFRGVENTNILSIYSSDPPLLNNSFNLKVYPMNGEVTPCGKKCAECLRYLEGQCLGCPAVDAYRGPL